MCDRFDKTSPLKLEDARVLGNVRIAPDVYLMTLAAPFCQTMVRAGQFVELKVPGAQTDLLRLPFSVYGVIPGSEAIEIMYQVVGKGTRLMTQCTEGDTVSLIGPIGRGWRPPAELKRALLVSGGLGAAPLSLLAHELWERGVTVDAIMGAPTAERLVCQDRLAACGTVRVATDDGSEGLRGFCTELSAPAIDASAYGYIATCGPQPMQAIVARQAHEANVRCEVSLERLMACGIGSCLSCVVETVSGSRRACVDGPVFDAEEVLW